MLILKFFIENLDSVVFAIAFIGLVFFLAKKGETKILNIILYKLVTEAERQFGSGTGELKFIAVSDWIYERLPLIIRFLFTAKDIKNLIENALTAARAKWEQNPDLQTYISGEITNKHKS